MKSFMKSLKEYIAEGLLDRVKNKEVSHEALIKEFLETNYKFRGSYTIKAANKGFVVDVKGDAEVTNKNITSLTNGLFEFGVVSSDFCCPHCKNLASLEGAPKHCRLFHCHFCSSLRTLEGIPKSCMYVSCQNCDSLKDLKGSPKACKMFNGCNCKSLTSLEGAPTRCKQFYCAKCENLTSLEDAPREVEEFYCYGCTSLRSLEGAPEKVKEFSCSGCKSLTSLEGIRCDTIECYDCGADFTDHYIANTTGASLVREANAAYRLPKPKNKV